MPYISKQKRASGAWTSRTTDDETPPPVHKPPREYGPPGTTDSPQYDLSGRPTGRQVGEKKNQPKEAR